MSGSNVLVAISALALDGRTEPRAQIHAALRPQAAASASSLRCFAVALMGLGLESVRSPRCPWPLIVATRGRGCSGIGFRRAGACLLLAQVAQWQRFDQYEGQAVGQASLQTLWARRSLVNAYRGATVAVEEDPAGVGGSDSQCRRRLRRLGQGPLYPDGPLLARRRKSA